MRNLILILLFSVTCFALNTVDRQEIPSYNMIINGGFENGLRGWAESGGGTLAKDTTTELIDKVSATFDASADTDYLYSADYTIPKGLLGAPCEASFVYQWDGGTAGQYQLQVLDGSDNIIVQTTDSTGTDPLAVTSSGNRGFKRLNFSCPTSGTLQFKLYANANASIITLDSIYVGSAQNVGSVDGIQYQYSEAAGDFSLSGTNSWSTDVAYSLPFKTQDGSWRMSFNIQGDTSSITSTQITFTGATFKNDSGVYQTINCSGGSGNPCRAVANPNASTIDLDNSGVSETTWRVSGELPLESKPTWATKTASETTYNLDTSAMAWSGYHTADCVWDVTSTSLAEFAIDASCTFDENINNNFGTVTSYNDGTPGNNYPGIYFTAKKTGLYKICATAVFGGETATTSHSMELYDITNSIGIAATDISITTAQTRFPVTLCGIVNVTSATAKAVYIKGAGSAGVTRLAALTGNGRGVQWSIFPITQNLPMPTIMNTVVSPDSDGVRIASASITNSGTPTVSLEDGDWISSITDGGVGTLTINVVAGVFSVAPNCSAAPKSVAAWTDIHITSASTSAVGVRTTDADDSNTAVDDSFYITCVGKK